jgi:hypothetical protein
MSDDFIEDLVRDGLLVKTDEQPFGLNEKVYRRPSHLDGGVYVLPDDEGIAVVLVPGTPMFSYCMLLDGEVLFEGSDYRPSPLHRTTEERALCLLAFLTLQPGDTDEEYFENYTPAQLAWATSFRCECASGYVRDREEDLCR